MRLTLSVVLLLLTLGAAVAIPFLDESNRSAINAQAALRAGALSRSVGPFQTALERDPANAYRWADLAEAYGSTGDTARARACFRRALELGPHILPVWVRDANFHYQLSEPEAALKASARVLETVPDYDAVLFSYFDHLVPDPSLIVGEIGSDRRATVSYLRRLMNAQNEQDAATVWRVVLVRKYADDPIASSYIDFLLARHSYDEATTAWASYVAGAFDYQGDSLYNPGFERKPTGSAFDWRIQTSDAVDTTREDANARDGKWCVHVAFHGDNNVSYQNVAQTTRVHPGRHLLSAWVRTDGLTTNEGLRFRVYDPESPGRLDLRTEPLSGTQPWTLLQRSFTVPAQTNLVTIELFRMPSGKFDNKIAGSAWIDDIRLTTELGHDR